LRQLNLLQLDRFPIVSYKWSKATSN